MPRGRQKTKESLEEELSEELQEEVEMVEIQSEETLEEPTEISVEPEKEPIQYYMKKKILSSDNVLLNGKSYKKLSLEDATETLVLPYELEN